MTTDEILALDPIKNHDTIIQELSAIGINLRPQKCYKCRNDYYQILLEELCLIEEVPLIPSQSYLWNGVKVNKNSPKELVEDFCKTHPKLCQKNNKNQ